MCEEGQTAAEGADLVLRRLWRARAKETTGRWARNSVGGSGMAGEDGWGSFSCVTVTTGRLVSNAPMDGSTVCSCGQH